MGGGGGKSVSKYLVLPSRQHSTQLPNCPQNKASMGRLCNPYFVSAAFLQAAVFRCFLPPLRPRHLTLCRCESDTTDKSAREPCTRFSGWWVNQKRRQPAQGHVLHEGVMEWRNAVFSVGARQFQELPLMPAGLLTRRADGDGGSYGRSFWLLLLYRKGVFHCCREFCL